MDETINRVLEFLKSIADRSGTKFIIALASIATVWHLATLDKVVGLYAILAVLFIAIGFFVFKYFEKKKETQ